MSKYGRIYVRSHAALLKTLEQRDVFLVSLLIQVLSYVHI